MGGTGRDEDQAELSWDSMNTAGPFQRQSGSNRLGGGDGQHHTPCLDRNSRKRIARVETVRNMLRIVSAIVSVAVEDVKDWSLEEQQPPCNSDT